MDGCGGGDVTDGGGGRGAVPIEVVFLGGEGGLKAVPMEFVCFGGGGGAVGAV